MVPVVDLIPYEKKCGQRNTGDFAYCSSRKTTHPIEADSQKKNGVTAIAERCDHGKVAISVVLGTLKGPLGGLFSNKIGYYRKTVPRRVVSCIFYAKYQCQ